MIELEGLTKRFVSASPAGRHAVEALAGVTVAWPAGGIRAVIGPNGAGKSTLFALLLGFLFPTEGAVRIGGLEARRWVRRHGAAYVPERFALPGAWRVRAALRALGRLEGLTGPGSRRRADELLDRFDLAGHAERRLDELSRGLLQRVGLAQALLAERELVVLDEPAEGLDPLWRARFRELVRELAAEGRTVLVASHDLAEVERLAERIVLLDEGRVRRVLEPEPPRESRSYRLELAEPLATLPEIFPGALPAGDGPASYHVLVDDVAELNRRLAALVEAGGLIVSVAPAAVPLEERVRRALDARDGS